MNPVKIFQLIAQILLVMTMVLMKSANGQGHVPMSQNPSYHTISYRVGPDGRAEMGGHGRELDRFFDGLGSGRVGSGFRNGRANSGGMFRRRMLPFRRWGFYRTF